MNRKEACRLVGLSNKGRSPWNKGLTKEIDERVLQYSVRQTVAKKKDSARIAEKTKLDWGGKQHSWYPYVFSYLVRGKMNLTELSKELNAKESIERIVELMVAKSSICISTNEDSCEFLEFDFLYKSDKGKKQAVGICGHKNSIVINRKATKERWREKGMGCLFYRNKDKF